MIALKLVGTAGQRAWISLPTGQNLGKKIREVTLSDANSFQTIARTMEYAYSRASHYKTEWIALREALFQAEKHPNLAEINLAIIEAIWTATMKRPPLHVQRTGLMKLTGDATNRVIQACALCKATEVVVGTGASLKSDVHDIPRLRRAGIRVFSQDFDGAGLTYRQYRRQQEGFLGKLSVMDAVLNIGGLEAYGLCLGAKLEPKEVL